MNHTGFDTWCVLVYEASCYRIYGTLRSLKFIIVRKQENTNIINWNYILTTIAYCIIWNWMGFIKYNHAKCFWVAAANRLYLLRALWLKCCCSLMLFVVPWTAMFCHPSFLFHSSFLRDDLCTNLTQLRELLMWAHELQHVLFLFAAYSLRITNKNSQQIMKSGISITSP